MPAPDDKVCPFCAETIRYKAVKCRFCGEFLEIRKEAEGRHQTPEEKRCPFCAETIQYTAIKCRFCGEALETPLGGRLSDAQQARHVPQGHDLGVDTQTVFEGTISRVALVGPTIVALIGIILASQMRELGRSVGMAYPLNSTLANIVGAGSLLYWLYSVFDFIHRRFHITNDRIEYEHGILTKKLDNLDMWRVQDVQFQQSLLERLFGLGSVLIMSSDRSSPVIRIGPIHGARLLYNTLKKVQLDADRRRGVIHIES